ncbi:GNAT family N-acetyltransferase [Pantoea coffeiphila]|uniref:GNAT family N-acetyltransferase n=1 Tax=Pantoea coffeiphila TaxID=1465635 RepID=UPI001960F5D8|nr:GNAT family N-acetyltransferase [Pantoea coffeiphila]MBM7343505.1 putative N-acetyltransferase YhbS [Pantoea coffeiphila]
MENDADIVYRVNYPIASQQFIDLLSETSLGARRPLADDERIAKMLKHANLTVTAWQGETLVGVARSVTDFTFCCYLSDLAVSEKVQKGGIGKALIAETCRQLDAACRLILIAAPLAEGYYPKIGMEHHHSAWTIKAGEFPA